MRWVVFAVALAALGGLLGGIYDWPKLLVALWGAAAGAILAGRGLWLMRRDEKA